jgi:hypothetical protein
MGKASTIMRLVEALIVTLEGTSIRGEEVTIFVEGLEKSLGTKSLEWSMTADSPKLNLNSRCLNRNLCLMQKRMRRSFSMKVCPSSPTQMEG